jgi:hypothetical protein
MQLLDGTAETSKAEIAEISENEKPMERGPSLALIVRDDGASNIGSKPAWACGFRSTLIKIPNTTEIEL